MSVKFSLNVTGFHPFSNTKDDVNRNQSDTHSKGKSKRKHKGEGRATDATRGCGDRIPEAQSY